MIHNNLYVHSYCYPSVIKYKKFNNLYCIFPFLYSFIDQIVRPTRTESGI